jgi:hypothetical protein
MQNPALAWILIGIGVGLALISGFAFPWGLVRI